MKMAPNAVCVNQENEPVSRTYQYRKIMKPMLERKRRARINRCLDELKDLMTGAYQCNEGENVAKLEKADILELTVKHLHTLRQQNKLHVRPDINFTERFRAGFSHCATEVAKFLNNVDQNAGVRVVQHLNDCVRRLDTTTITYPMNPPPVAPVRPLIPAKYTNYYPGQPDQQHADPEFFRQQPTQLQHHTGFHPQQAAAVAAAAYMAHYEDLKIKQQLDTSADQSVWRPWG